MGCNWRNPKLWIFRIPNWAIYVGLAATLYAMSLFLPDPDVLGSLAELKDPAGAMLDAVKSISTLVSALNTTLCAGAAAFSIKGKEWSSHWNRAFEIIILCVFLCGAVTYYALYLSSIAVLELVASGSFGLSSPRLLIAIEIQYYGQIVGFFLLGLVFCLMMDD
ncbi:MAG: hypothetical protein IPN84_07980 [Sphingomonadales bacterium]|nr:hypothetical protein [Sphingomonadales bacterium]